MHIRGLKRLVDLRGGYEAFINDSLVTRSVTWYMPLTPLLSALLFILS